MTLPEKIKKAILHGNLVRKGDIVIVGVSGGPDSVCLLSVLFSLQYELGISLHVAHLNHGIRAEGKKDQVFVEELCSRLNLPVTVYSLPNNLFKKKGSWETLARDYRLKFFQKVAKQKKARIIALGHNQDDLAETVLMRMIRGSGLLGLRGILFKNTMGGMDFVRPMLNTSRKEIESYLKDLRIPYRVDKSNKSLKFFRNQVRLELIPFIESKFNRKARCLLASLAETLGEDYDFLEHEVQKQMSKVLYSKTETSILLKIASLQNMHRSLRRMILRKCFALLKGNLMQLTFIHISEIEELMQSRSIGSVVHVPGGVKVTLKSDKILNFMRIKT